MSATNKILVGLFQIFEQIDDERCAIVNGEGGLLVVYANVDSSNLQFVAENNDKIVQIKLSEKKIQSNSPMGIKLERIDNIVYLINIFVLMLGTR